MRSTLPTTGTAPDLIGPLEITPSRTRKKLILSEYNLQKTESFEDTVDPDLAHLRAPPPSEQESSSKEISKSEGSYQYIPNKLDFTMTNSKGKETAGSSSKRREETQLSVDEQISELSKPMEVLQVHRE